MAVAMCVYIRNMHRHFAIFSVMCANSGVSVHNTTGQVRGGFLYNLGIFSDITLVYIL